MTFDLFSSFLPIPTWLATYPRRGNDKAVGIAHRCPRRIRPYMGDDRCSGDGDSISLVPGGAWPRRGDPDPRLRYFGQDGGVRLLYPRAHAYLCPGRWP